MQINFFTITSPLHIVNNIQKAHKLGIDYNAACALPCTGIKPPIPQKEVASEHHLRSASIKLNFSMGLPQKHHFRFLYSVL